LIPAALLEHNWILRYTATSQRLVVTDDVPLQLLPNATFALGETSALHLLALFQRQDQSADLVILHRPEGGP
jgi:hypothetical protein